MGSDRDHYLSVAAILGCEFCERISAFGIGSSLTLFLRSKLGYTIESATIWTAVWGAFATIFSLLGGYISDARLGRKRTILMGCFIYFCALLAVSIITYLFEITDDLELSAIETIFWISLYVMSVGGGAIKANVGVFGADQLPSEDVIITNTNAYDDHMENDQSHSVPAELVQSYWNWFYFIINAGALISYTLISYLCQDVSFALGWSIPTVAMLCAIIIFLLRSSHYREPQHDRSIIGQFISITWYSLRNRHRKQEIKQDLQENILNTFHPDENDDAFNVRWLDVAKLRYSGEYDDELVDQVALVYRVFAFLPFMTLYWIVYSAMNSLFYSQGCQMNYMVTTSFNFPIATLNDADIIIILILVPLMDRCLYPFLAGPYGCCRLGMLKKIGVGYFVLALAMLVAGVIEIWRKQSETYIITSTCDSSIYISSLSVLWQIPQYLLVGVSEVFASITSLEFFSSQAPDEMKSIVYAANLMVTGIGFLLAALLVFVVDLWRPQWIPNDLDDGYLEYYFFLIAGIMIVTLIAFIPAARKYKYRPGTDASTMELTKTHLYKPIPTNDE
eukprot:174721_1